MFGSGITFVIVALVAVILCMGAAIVVMAGKMDGNQGASRRPRGKPVITAHLEFKKDTGELHYIIENSGTADATDVEVYLPECQEIASSRNGEHSHQISAAIGYVTLQRHRRIHAGQCIETPIMGLPPTQESVMSVIGLGLQAELRWRKDENRMVTEEKILPVFIRKRSNLYG